VSSGKFGDGSAFYWPTLGFRLVRQNIRPTGASPVISLVAIVVPCWPLLVVLLYPEVRRLFRAVRASTLRKQAAPKPIQSSSIEQDLPCVHCGYNLRTLQSTMRCPECGLLASDTLTLSAELSRSRPGWLRWLVVGNLMLLASRLMLVLVYAAANDPEAAGVFALATSAIYLIGIFLLTFNEHPFLRSPSRGPASWLRLLASASLLLVIAGVCEQRFRLLPPGLGGVGTGYLTMGGALLIFGWICYCACVVLELYFLAQLAGRLLDDFMDEHCRIAGIGAGASNLLALWLTRNIDRWWRTFVQPWSAWTWFGVMLVWLLFLVWSAFMNGYCAFCFLQQSWIADQRWREQKSEAAAVSHV
jgi:hypothetical protein